MEVTGSSESFNGLRACTCFQPGIRDEFLADVIANAMYCSAVFSHLSLLNCIHLVICILRGTANILIGAIVDNRFQR